MPHICRSRYPPGSAQLGGLLTFAGARSGDKVAPKAAICTHTIELANCGSSVNLFTLSQHFGRYFAYRPCRSERRLGATYKKNQGEQPA